jgi:hypothetical protein
MLDTNLHLAATDIAGPPGADGKLTGPDGHINQYDCPVIPDPNLPNQCLIDTAAAQALCASLSTDDDGGLGGKGTPGTCSDNPPPSAALPVSSPLAVNLSQAFTGFFGAVRWSVL